MNGFLKGTGTRTVRTFLGAAAVLMALPGCGSARMNSAWRADPLQEGGAVASWSGVEDREEDGVRLGLLNDGEYLYVRLVAEEPQAERAWRHGFTLWMGGTEKEDRRIGVRVVPDIDLDALRPSGPGDTRTPESAAKRAERLRGAIAGIDVLSPSGEVEERRAVPADAGIDFRVEATTAVACVFRIPVAFLPDAGGTMGLAVVGEEFEPGDLGGARGGGGPGGGGRGPGGGGRGGGPGGGGGPPGGGDGRSGGRPSPPQPMDLWTTFTLAEPGE